MANLLSIIQAVQDELGLARTSAVAGSGDLTNRQMFALLNREGRSLVKAAAWPALTKLGTITTINGTSDYDVPSDFDRLIDQTQWDRTNGFEMVGPDTPQADRWRRESTVSASGVRKNYRYIGGALRIYPTPSVDNETLVYEYVSKNWCESSEGAAQSEMAADEDVPLFDDQLLILGVKWRFISAKGLDASAYKIEYDNYLDAQKGADLGGGPLNMEGTSGSEILVDMNSVPDSGYGA